MFHFLERFNQIAGAAQRATDYHKRILHAVAQKDSDKAEHEIKQHLLDVIRVLREYYKYNLDFLHLLDGS